MAGYQLKSIVNRKEVIVEEGNALKQQLASSPIQQSVTLRNCVEQTLGNYFSQLGGQPVTDLYDMVLSEVEIPLLEKVLEHTRGNQTKAAEMLGINRGTLRKKFKQYNLI